MQQFRADEYKIPHHRQYLLVGGYFMRTFVADIIPRIQRFSKRLDDLTKLTNQHWVSLGDIDQAKRVYIFRANNKLLISENGRVEKGSWEYLGNQSLLLETKDESFLLKHGFFDENVIALKLDSTDNYAFFVNETKYNGELNNIADIIRFLDNKYLRSNNGGGLGSKERPAEFDNIPFSYTVESETDCFNIFWGSHITYSVKYSSGQLGVAYKGTTTDKYFYMDSTFGKQYFNSMDEVAFNLNLYLNSRNNR